MRVLPVGSARDTGVPLFTGTFDECCAFIWRRPLNLRRTLMIVADGWVYGTDEVEALRGGA